MLPGTTASPPNFLTPRRRPAESRPLRELPPAFLCAMAQSSFFLAAAFLAAAFLAGAFLAAVFFGAAFFVAALFAGAFSAPVLPSSAFGSAAFRGLASGFLPSVRMSVLRPPVRSLDERRYRKECFSTCKSQ